ncbi:MAG: DUF421 domain-containing protein [Clostridia bacterium]|nr:DUF421 domain-containing protein [Clostridia bacterium]
MIVKPEKKPVLVEDLNLDTEYSGIPYDLVVDGVILNENLQKIGKDKVWLAKEVKKFGFKPEEALIVTVNGKGDIFCQKKET